MIRINPSNTNTFFLGPEETSQRCLSRRNLCFYQETSFTFTSSPFLFILHNLEYTTCELGMAVTEITVISYSWHAGCVYSTTRGCLKWLPQIIVSVCFSGGRGAVYTSASLLVVLMFLNNN